MTLLLPRTLATASLLAALTGSPGAAQVRPSGAPEVLSAAEAFELLNPLNEKEKLVPASFMLPLSKYKALQAESCFGVRLPNGLRIAGESNGRDYGVRGHETSAKGEKRAKVLIGAFYSEFPFLLQDMAFPAGPYLVMALADALELSGDDPTGATHYDNYRRRQVPSSKVEEIKLPAPLPAELFAEKSAAAPRFRISLEKGQIDFTVGDNKLRLLPK